MKLKVVESIHGIYPVGAIIEYEDIVKKFYDTIHEFDPDYVGYVECMKDEKEQIYEISMCWGLKLEKIE